MKSIMTFSSFTALCVSRSEQNGRYATGRLYKNALHSYALFLGRPSVAFTDISRDNLKSYQQWLTDRGKSLNTVSTYLRMLRSIYNKGVDHGYARYIRRLFHDVYTGIDIRHKKTLCRKDLRTLLFKDPGSKVLRRTQYTARLCYQLCGMPFVDLTHIRKSDIKGDTLEYHRMKTGTTVRVQLLKPALQSISWLRMNAVGADAGKSPGLLQFNCEHSFRSNEGYMEYQGALRRFNTHLKQLGRKLGIKDNLSSYTLRHSWATTAKYIGAPVEMISELLGHKSVKTTQIYLSAFDDNKLAEVNRRVYKYVRKERQRSNVKKSVTFQVTRIY
ncbi:MAG: site-specific integrase [Prevotella sp.]|jgi:integrase|nr:site-specific integrase [Prevotella sp.]MCH4182798.1 site-specific integrase [Prevotella sp.]MCH4211244.1 site-specific integrase [Prevotella sp.]MCH4241244.1 site-specific integrase [Prevotella sp.]